MNRARRGALAAVVLVSAVGGAWAWRPGATAPGPGPAPVGGRGAATGEVPGKGLAATGDGLAATGGAPAAEDVAEGAWLFQAKGCAQCHVRMAGTFPDLSDAADWAGERAEGMTAEEYLAESILDPPASISPQLPPGSELRMPRLNVTDEEVDALVAYLLGH